MLEATHRSSDFIAPDIRIFKKDGAFAVELNQLSADSILIDATYSKIYQDTDNDTVHSFLGENMKKAQWLRESIRQRCDTLMECATELLKNQQAFFAEGPDWLHPYSRREMAEALGRSESTISRALRGKYVECEWGMFPMDYFFPKPSVDTHPLMTRNTIESSIQMIIGNEDRRTPMSDEAIVDKLGEMGIEVSRRTVAKYRDELGIPASFRRRIFD